MAAAKDRKSTRLNSSHTVIYTLSLHDALPISLRRLELLLQRRQILLCLADITRLQGVADLTDGRCKRSEEHTSELQSHSDLHSFPTRRSSDLPSTTGIAVAATTDLVVPG